MEFQNKETENIEHTVQLEDGCIPIRSIEIVQFLNPEGEEGIAVRWQGSSNIVVELGMLDYARIILTLERFTPNNGVSDAEPE